MLELSSRGQLGVSGKGISWGEDRRCKVMVHGAGGYMGGVVGSLVWLQVKVMWMSKSWVPKQVVSPPSNFMH